MNYRIIKKRWGNVDILTVHERNIYDKLNEKIKISEAYMELENATTTWEVIDGRCVVMITTLKDGMIFIKNHGVINRKDFELERIKEECCQSMVCEIFRHNRLKEKGIKYGSKTGYIKINNGIVRWWGNANN